MSTNETIEQKAYDLITDDGEIRTCQDISDKACEEAPNTFALVSLNGFCTKLAEQLASPGMVIPWILSALNASVVFSGFLIPIKNAGSLLPQLFISAKIRGFSKRKYFWVAAGASQGLILILMALVVFSTSGNLAGYLIILGVLIFNVASGVGSIAFKDVMGKTVPKGKRGRLLAVRATGGGILTTVAGLIFYFWDFKDTESLWPYIGLLLAAAILWWLSAMLYAQIAEKPGATEGGRTPAKELRKALKLLKKDGNFVNFLITRSLLMAVPLLMPFFVVYAKEELEASLAGLGLFVVIGGISNAISSPIWGKFADRDSRRLMQIAASISILSCLYVLSFPFWDESLKSVFSFAPVFFLNVISHAGARLGRKTYLVDYAPKKERPLYVSLANTFIGVITIISGFIGVIAELYSLEALIIFLGALLVISMVLASRLKSA